MAAATVAMTIGLTSSAVAAEPDQSSDGGVPEQIAAIETRLLELEGLSASQDTEIDELQSDVAALQAENATQQSKIAALEAQGAAQQSRIDSLEAENTARQSEIATLGAADDAQRGDIDALVTGNTTQQSELDELRSVVLGSFELNPSRWNCSGRSVLPVSPSAMRAVWKDSAAGWTASRTIWARSSCSWSGSTRDRQGGRSRPHPLTVALMRSTGVRRAHQSSAYGGAGSYWM